MPYIESGTPITLANRHDWLAMRNDPERPFIGSSSFAEAVGMSPYGTPMELYLRMIGKLPPKEEDWRMRRGHYLQPFCMREYELATGDAIIRQEIYYNGPVFHGIQLGATVDGESLNDFAIECKSHGFRMKEGYGDVDEEEDGIPVGFFLQVLAQVGFAGHLKAGRLVVAIDGEEPKIFPVKPREDDLSNLLAELEKFCWHVSTRTPPPFTVRDEASLYHLAYEWDGTATCKLDDSTGMKVAKLVELGLKKKPLDAEVRRIEAEQKVLKGYIQDALKGTGVGSWRDYTVQVKTIHRKAIDPCDYNTVTATKAK